MSDQRPETIVVHAGRPAAAPGAPLNAPVVLSSTYRAGGEYAYVRHGSPTVASLEEALGELEGGRALAFSSGMAAATSCLETLALGSRVVAPSSAYFDVRSYLREGTARGRFSAELVDVTNTEATLAACVGADLLWLESPTNPLIGVADLPALIAGARERGVRVVVDNTFATPLLQRPLELGADAVMHSVTKYLSGHADVLMGAVVTRDEELLARIHRERDVRGGVAGAHDAFLALRGLRTLAIRLERQQANAQALAERLAAHPAVERVRYPGLPSDPGHERAKRQMAGFGAMVSFEVHGGADAAERVCRAARVIAYATSLGGVETLMERRSRWAGEREGGTTPEALIRMSVGIEHVDDLWADLEQALAHA
jgi:cystathionine gamma-synthase